MNQKEDTEALMNDGIAFAEKMLREHGEFHPFARALDVGGKIINIAAFDGREFPPGKEALEFLEAALRVTVKKDRHVAVAVFSNVTVKDQLTGKQSDAVQVGLEHSGGYSINVLFPYEEPEGDVSFGELVATSRPSSIYEQS